MIVQRRQLEKVLHVPKDQNGICNGIGTIKWPSDTVLKAEWKDGKMVRMIQIQTKQGQWEFTSFENNIYYGIKTRTSGRYTYVGQMNQVGLEDGNGTKTLQDHTVFKGLFKEGNLVSGSVKYPNGDVYEGRFNDKRQKHDQKCKFTIGGKKFIGSIFNDGESGDGFIGQKYVRWENKKLIE